MRGLGSRRLRTGGFLRRATVTLPAAVSVRAVASSYWRTPPLITVRSRAAAAVSIVTVQPLPIVTLSAAVGTTPPDHVAPELQSPPGATQEIVVERSVRRGAEHVAAKAVKAAGEHRGGARSRLRVRRARLRRSGARPWRTAWNGQRPVAGPALSGRPGLPPRAGWSPYWRRLVPWRQLRRRPARKRRTGRAASGRVRAAMTRCPSPTPPGVSRGINTFPRCFSRAAAHVSNRLRKERGARILAGPLFAFVSSL